MDVSSAACAELTARSLVARFDQGCRAIKRRTCQIAFNEVNGYMPQVNVVDKVSKAGNN